MLILAYGFVVAVTTRAKSVASARIVSVRDRPDLIVSIDMVMSITEPDLTIIVKIVVEIIATITIAHKLTLTTARLGTETVRTAADLKIGVSVRIPPALSIFSS